MKILHLSFHIGTSNALQSVLSDLDVELTTNIVTSGRDGYYYNMTHDRAKKAWEQHKDYYNQFDCIITSDTAPLSRIFLQNEWKKKLIVWISNRFDYSDSREKGFPDDEYYELMSLKFDFKKRYLIPNCSFEAGYLLIKTKLPEINTIINPVSKPIIDPECRGYYIPTYHNDKLFNLYEKCKERGLEVTTGRYKDKYELAKFEAIIHIPYTWNSIALWDALSVSIPYFVPSKNFLLKLSKTKNFWFQEANYLKKSIEWCEFYKDHKFVKYFDSFDDIKNIKIDINYNEIYEEAERHFKLNQEKWKNILNI